MSERAIVAVFALLGLVGEVMTEFSLVFILVIKSLNSIMSSSTFVSLGTFFSVGKLTKFRSVEIIISSSILYRMEVVTTFVIVGILLGTLMSLEVLQLQVLDLNLLSSSMMSLVNPHENFRVRAIITSRTIDGSFL